MFVIAWGFAVFVFCVCPGVCFRMMGGYDYGPRVAAGLARGSTVRVPAWRGGSSFLVVVLRGHCLSGAEREYADLTFPGDGLLGRGGVPEFRAGFLGAPGVAFPPGDVQGVQRGAGGGVRRGGECLQR